jgi:hypothetical protein
MGKEVGKRSLLVIRSVDAWYASRYVRTSRFLEGRYKKTKQLSVPTMVRRKLKPNGKRLPTIHPI